MSPVDHEPEGARPGASVAAFPSADLPSGGRLLTADEVAARWQVPKAQVYRLVREGRGLPVVRIGRYYRFRLAEIEAWEAAGGC